MFEALYVMWGMPCLRLSHESLLKESYNARQVPAPHILLVQWFVLAQWDSKAASTVTGDYL